MQQIIDWHFKEMSPTDYNIDIDMTVESKTFKYILRKAKPKLEKALKKDINIDEKVKVFYIPKEYFKLIKTGIHSVIKAVQKDVNKDFIDIISHEIESAKFEKIESQWHIKVIVWGVFYHR